MKLGGKGGSQKLSNLSRTTQLVSGRFWNQLCMTSKIVDFLYTTLPLWLMDMFKIIIWNSWILVTLLHQYMGITESSGFMGWEESQHIRSYYIEQNQDQLWWIVGNSQSHCRMSSRKDFWEGSTKGFKVHWSITAKNVSYDGQQPQASAVAGLTGWAKALHSMSEEVSQMVTISLNSAIDGNHRAEITCAECGPNHCLNNELLIHTCKTMITQTPLICFRWKDNLLYYVFNI